jgi:2-polyprenyl-6-methoxyphenol hydroxylase-like FAD-dependent oxidoreductase
VVKVAINGAGIAGPTLAYWLSHYGHEPTLIEKAPRLRTGGYVVDFWGGGYTVAERMGLRDQLHTAGYEIEEVRLVDRSGRRVGGFEVDAFRRNMNGRFVTVPRTELAAMIYHSIEGQVETLFGENISAIAQDDSGVRLRFDSGRSGCFDLVIGAGGIHSPVRTLVFGPEERVAKDLEYRVAAFEAAGYRRRDELVYVAYTTPGRMVSRFAMRGDRTLFLFVFTTEHMTGPDPTNLSETQSALRGVFGGAGWECPQILNALDRACDVYFDRVGQIVMDSWSLGRVALIGDAACAVSLLAGEGTGLAMIQAYILAGELHRAGVDHRLAFHRYETRLRPLIAQRQKSARAFASAFTPKTAAGLWTRNQVSKLLNVRPLADWIIRREFADDIELPAYPA